MSTPREHIQFVTGRLAEPGLRETVATLSDELGFAYSIQVLPISVAGLMTPTWIAARLQVEPKAACVMVPGYCQGDLAPVEEAAGVPVERGPRDFRQLGLHFGRSGPPADYGAYDIEIIAEINHCPRLSREEILQTARRYAADGADVIDVGCEPGATWPGVGDTVRALRDAGHRVSIDSFDSVEITAATRAGAELVLSVNSTNRHAAPDWGCQVVAIPDEPATMAGLHETIEFLSQRGVPLRIDPVLEPIAFGFAASLGRYLHIRERYPHAEILMGIGNATELLDADSAAVNTVLLGFCQEQGIRSVLTTQVIPWARSSVRECDLARRLVHYAVTHRVLPKHLEPRLVMLRDEEPVETPPEEMDRLAAEIKDHNYRIFASGGKIHLVTSGLHLSDDDPFALMERLLSGDTGRQGEPASRGEAALPKGRPRLLDPAHAYYLGYEMCKAHTALLLGKQYMQDEPLDWGFLTLPEKHHYLKSSPPAADKSSPTS